MKSNERLKIILSIVITVLVTMVGFLGVYVQDGNKMKNILPDYLLGMDLQGYRRIELKVSEDTATDGEETETSESLKTEENYKKSKEILEARLKKLGVDEYYIRREENSETIVVQIPENDKADSIVAQLQLQGKFEIIDKDTSEVLMNNDDIEKVETGYGSTNNGTVVFLNIEFNKEGTEKFKNITNTYVKTEKTEESSKTEQTENSEETSESATEESKQITIKVDDSDLLSTYFTNEISNGILQLTIGSSTDATTDELEEYYEQGNKMVSLLDSGKMPLKYTTNTNKYIQTDIVDKHIVIVVVVGIALLTAVLAFTIIKFKENGILGVISFVGYIAALTIILRYTNVVITIEGIIGFIASIVLEYLFMYNIMKNNEDFWKTYIKYIWILVPVLIMAVVFALTINSLRISSFGMVLFWGIVTKLIWNAGITRNILITKKQ